MFGRKRKVEGDAPEHDQGLQPVKTGSGIGCKVPGGDLNDSDRVVVVRQSYMGVPDRDFRFTVDDSMISVVYSEDSGYADEYVDGSVQPSKYWEKTRFRTKPVDISVLSFSDIPFTVVTKMTFKVPGGDLNGTVRSSFKFVKSSPRSISSVLSSPYAEESTVYNVHRRFITAGNLERIIRTALLDAVEGPLFRDTEYGSLDEVQDAIIQRIRDTPFFKDRSIDVSEVSISPEDSNTDYMELMTMTREGILERMESMGLIDGQLMTQAFVSMYSVSMSDDDYPVCDLELRGVSKRNDVDMVKLKVFLDGEAVRSIDIPVVTGDSDRYKVTVPRQLADGFIGRTVKCTITATDKYLRGLVSASRDIRFGEAVVIPSVDVDARFEDVIRPDPETFAAEVVRGTITSNRDASVSLALRSGDLTIWQSGVNLYSETPSDFIISLDRAAIGSIVSPELILNVSYNGQELYSEISKVIIDRYAPIGMSSDLCPNIIGELNVPDFVDTHDTLDGIVRIGSLLLDNKGDATDIIVSVVLDGNTIRHSRVDIPFGLKELGLSAPSASMVSDDTCSRELTVHVTDTSGNVVLHRVHTLGVRSRLEMDLNDVTTRSVQFINPRNPDITRLIHDSKGLLAQSMGDPYSICGYQNGGSDVVRQMEAAYMMLHRMGMRYVSDTFAFNRSEGNYQYVRMPDTVLNDRSGNCLELCILYASLLEAMGLEPVLAFVPGHALVGVVLSTDLYSSRSAYRDEDIPYVTMTLENGKADVMFVEITACAWNDDFVDAVCIAYNKVTDEFDAVCDEEGHVFVRMMRRIGVYPLTDV